MATIERLLEGYFETYTLGECGWILSVVEGYLADAVGQIVEMVKILVDQIALYYMDSSVHL